MSENIILQQKDGLVATLTLNRPEVVNSLNAALFEQLLDHLDKLEQDPSCRAIVLTGAGRGFCSGQDLKEIPMSDKLVDEVEHVVRTRCNELVRKFSNLRVPTIGAVNGVAAGAGASLALCCDIVVAEESTTFIQAFSRIGLVPDTGATFHLPRLVGLAKARALTFLAEKLSANEAERLGLIYKVVPDGTLLNEATAIASHLANMPTRALALTRKALLASHSNSLEEQLSYEAELQREAAGTSDFREGVLAFIEKRQAQFTGE